jgi:hypothetical protein
MPSFASVAWTSLRTRARAEGRPLGAEKRWLGCRAAGNGTTMPLTPSRRSRCRARRQEAPRRRADPPAAPASAIPRRRTLSFSYQGSRRKPYEPGQEVGLDEPGQKGWNKGAEIIEAFSLGFVSGERGEVCGAIQRGEWFVFRHPMGACGRLLGDRRRDDRSAKDLRWNPLRKVPLRA